MFKNYFKTAVRNLMRKKGFSLLNILGLAIGISCAALIFLWVEDELTYNSYFKKKDQLYYVMENQTYDGKTFTFGATPGLLGPAIKAEIPGIRNTVRMNWGSRVVFSKDDQHIYGTGSNVDPEFFDMFNVEFIHGTAASAFKELHSVVINERLALKLFNSLDVVGKTVRIDNNQDYVVTGVYKTFPLNAKFQNLDWFAPFEIYLKKNEWLQYWGNNGIQTYVELQPEANVAQVNAKLKNFIKNKQKEAIAEPLLLSANDWRLRNQFTDGKQSGGRIKYVKLFSLIAWIIIILACINFMNLATARSEQRAREVGVRKVMGSGKGMLVSQFLTEAIIMSFVAVLLACFFTWIALPGFNKIADKQLTLSILKPLHLTFILAMGFVCGLVAGSYPAFYLSSFNPIKVLKGLKLPSSGSVAFIRRGLVVTQFIVSITLIICTLVIYRQVMHAQSRELGINKNNLIYMDQQLINVQQNGNLGLHFNAIRNELLSTGYVENATLSNSSAFEVGSNSAGFQWPGKDPNKQILIGMNWVTPGYIKTMGMALAAGRDFYPDGMADSNNVIINEAFAKVISKSADKAVGQLIERDSQKLQVIGVIKDYVYNNMYGKADPLIVFYDPKAESTSNLTIRFKQGADYKAALAKVETIIKTNNPTFPFEYKFVDEDFQKLFQSENLIGTLAALFAGLAILISCLGLFGLAAYTAEKRTREIGVRKVLGASVTNLTTLLSKDFLYLVALSCVFSFPLAWWFMHSWLQQFEYRIHIEWWMFVLPGVLAIVIALLTVSFQAIKAALMNPVKSLRSE